MKNFSLSFFPSLALAFVFFLCIGTSTFAFESPVSQSVELLESRGVFENEKTRIYRADDFVTRGEFVQWAMKNARFSPKNYKGREPFSDIKNRNPLKPYVAGAYASGGLDFLTGKKKFLPQKKITRIQALQILFAIEGISSFQQYSRSSEEKYTDLPTDPQLRAIILRAKQDGLISRTSKTTLFPSKKLRLSEAVNMLARIAIQEKKSENLKKKTDLQTVQSLIEDNYWKKEEIENGELEKAAIEGLVSSLDDPYSVYLPPKQAEAFTKFFTKENVDTTKYAGIGVAVQKANKGGILITEIFPGSPAGSAGLQVGDIIIAVEKKDSTAAKTISEVTDTIKGPVGTKVLLTILRGEKSFDIQVKRKNITLDGYSSIMAEVKDDIVWIKIRSFGSHTAGTFAKILEENVVPTTKGVIIDLRYNPGGLMSGAQQMLGEILPKDNLALRMITANGEQTLEVKGSGKFADIPIAVFQNEYSASASEIFAASIKDYQRGKIIGSKSFGKGIAQNLYNLSDGGTLKLTTSEFRSPLGNAIHKVGIEPDVLLTKLDNNSFFQVAKRFLK